MLAQPKNPTASTQHTAAQRLQPGHLSPTRPAHPSALLSPRALPATWAQGVSARAARPCPIPRSLPGRAHASGLSPSSRNGRAWHAEIPGELSFLGTHA